MNRFKVYGLTCVVLMVATFAGATTIVMPDDAQLIAKAPAIVEGTVLSTAVVVRDGRIVTETVVSVSRALKGTLPETITVRELGGELGGRITKVFGTPEFAEGEKVLLFLEKTGDGVYRTIDLFVGKFAAAKMLDGRPLWLRHDEVPNVVLLDRDFNEIQAASVQRDAVRFEAFVADRVAGRPGVNNYGIANPALARETGGARRVESNFTLISEPTIYRWFQFEDNRTANWYSGGTQSGYSGGGISELQTAMSAWTSYSQAKILFAYAGTRSGTFGGLDRANGANEVLFDDPLGEIAGTFNRSTGGVVGTGGFNGVTSGGNWTSPFHFDAAHPQATLRAYNIVEGNLTIQDGVTPANGVSSARLAEIVAHEFGHTLGFGHTPDGTALMYASVTGRGASLKDDDQIGARWLYPNGNATEPLPPPQAPAAPSGVVATASGTNLIVDWNDNSNNETGFSIYLAAATGGFDKVGDVGVNSKRAEITGLTAGTWRVYVVAFNASGNSPHSNTATATIGAAKPVAGFTFTPTTGTAGVTTFTFYDQSSNASTRSWDFGDGTTSTAAVANKIFARAGRFTVTLTVTGAGGATDTATQSVNVAGPLTAAFSWSPVNPTTNDTITFTDESTGGVTAWRWVFGDGETSSAQNPNKRFSSAITYNVTLTVWRNSESSTAAHQITVRHPAPVTPAIVADFEVSPAAPVAGENITFTDRSTGSPTSWSWSFGDGRTSTAREVGAIYGAPGTYMVTLTASNGGNSGTITKPVTVSAAATAHRSLISVTTQTNGVGGTAWRTELSLFNAGTQGAYVHMHFLPGAGGSVITRNEFLAPRESVTYANTLLDLFGVPNGAGAVAIEATSAGARAQLRITSRTFTGGPDGTYGQAVPDVVALDKTLYLTGMQLNAKFRTNVGLVNRGNTDMPVALTLYDASGAILGTTSVTIPATNFQQQPLAAYFPSITGRSFDVLSLRVVANAADAVSAYASVIDNNSQDPIYVQAVPAPTGGSLTLPVVGRALGVNGTFWRSDVALFNPTSERVNLSIRYGGASKTLSLPSRDTMILDDVLSEFGHAAGQGALTVTWDAGQTGPIVTSRTYTTTEGPGTYGQSIDPVAAFDATSYVPGLRNDDSYRSNVGFVNGGTTSESFFVTLYSAAGDQLAQTVRTLGPGQQSQSSITSLFPNLPPSAGSFTLEVRGDGDARLFTYGSMVDNLSGDPVFFAGR